MTRRILAIAFALPLALAGCSQSESDEATTTSETTATSSSESATPTTTTTTATSEQPTTSEDVAPAPAPEQAPEQAPAPEAAPQQPAAPHVVECLAGTPRPALMSDGTIQNSDWCFEQMGGAQYLEQESAANAGPAYQSGYGYDEQGNANPSSGELQTQHGCEQGYITDPELCAAVGVTQ